MQITRKLAVQTMDSSLNFYPLNFHSLLGKLGLRRALVERYITSFSFLEAAYGSCEMIDPNLRSPNFI